MLRALGSKAEERAKRRKKKKDSYAKYLESSTWRKIRAKALARDKNICRACGEKAQHVHHVRYPKNLGEEKMDWLYSLCVPCHDAIHRAAQNMTLRAATELILAAPGTSSNVIHLADDWRLSKSATKARQAKRYRSKPSRVSKRKKRAMKAQHVKDDARKKSKIELENERLHAIFKDNRERRERRWGA